MERSSRHQDRGKARQVLARSIQVCCAHLFLASCSSLIQVSQLLFDETCYIARATGKDGELLGHATFVLFPYEPLDGRGVWISQLVVKSSVRGRGIARGLLTAAVSLSNEGDVVAAGIASSHPHAIRAFKRATTCGLDLDPDFIASRCASLLSASNIAYLRFPNNTIFGFWHAEQDADSASLVRSNFYVDHSEAEKALQDEREWDLGALEEGCEFVVVAPIRASQRKRRSASAGSAGSGGKSEKKAEGK